LSDSASDGELNEGEWKCTGYIFDCETDGLLDELTTIHSLVLKDINTGEVISCSDHEGYMPIEYGLELLEKADLIIGHNIIKFDILALRKVYPKWKPKGTIRDTMVCARLVWPSDELKRKDKLNADKGYHPRNLVGKDSLEAWGHRLAANNRGGYKGDFKGPWHTWTKEMQGYCEQDVEVTFSLWNLIVSKEWPEESLELEHQVAAVLARQETHGFCFDKDKAAALYAKLSQRRLELLQELQQVFPPKKVVTTFTPKVNNKKLGYVKGVPFEKTTIVEFNPSSRQQVSSRLIELHGWQPTEFTPDGHPKVDEEILSVLPYKEAKVLSEYFMVEKRIGQLAEGKEAWLKKERNGRIHGRVNPNGAVTGRMTHSNPNMGQVPSNEAPYGKDCRELFTVPKGKKLTGIDADALELRDLAGFMAKYDGGAYVKAVLEGKKEEGTDNHSINCRALGMEPKGMYPMPGRMESGRNISKTWFYAYIYGAGDEKLGWTRGVFGPKKMDKRGNLKDQKAIKAGREDRDKFQRNLPALGKLVDAVKSKAKKQGYLRGLDNRKLYVRALHSALNTLLQSAGAVQMKMALVIFDTDLSGVDPLTILTHGREAATRYTPGVHYEFVANVHDEWQVEHDEDLSDVIGPTGADAIRKAGERLNFRCPLKGDFKVGNNWAETH